MEGSSDRLQLEAKYRDTVALEYEARRRSDALWQREHGAAEAMLRRVRATGAKSVLDIPVGTGRFAPIYKDLDLQLIGLDISEDMLRQAKAACEAEGVDAVLKVGNAFEIDLPDNSVDVALCIRFMQHIDYQGFEKVIVELKRVARTHLILGIHLVTDDKRGLARFIRALFSSPIETIDRVWKGLIKSFRRRIGQAKASSEYMTRTDKGQDRVLAHLKSLDLSIADDRELLTSLRPGKAVSYRFLLLELPPA